MSENIETPEGWEPMGNRFVRAYGHKLAVMASDPSDGTWLPWIHESVNSVVQGRWKPLPEAVAWANAELGVPKPVEVLEQKFPDGSYVLKDTENTRWATVCKFGVGWYVGTIVDAKGYAEEHEALETARAYVRGDA